MEIPRCIDKRGEAMRPSDLIVLCAHYFNVSVTHLILLIDKLIAFYRRH